MSDNAPNEAQRKAAWAVFDRFVRQQNDELVWGNDCFEILVPEHH
jgi:hypothetical protein